MKRLPFLVLTTAIACGGGNTRAPSPAISASTLRPGHVEKTVHAVIDMTVTGARPLALQREPAKLRMVIIEGDRNPQIVHFFSVSSAEPIKLDDTTFLQFDADLAPGLYSGPGTYELSTQAPAVGGTQSNLSSASYVQFLDLQPKPLGPKFSVLSRPCTLTVVGTEGVRGTVVCPKLTTEDGRSVTLRWSWELT